MKNKIIKKKNSSIFIRIFLIVGGIFGIFAAAPWNKENILYHRGGYPTDTTANWAITVLCTIAIVYAVLDKSTIKDRGLGLYTDHICPNCEQVFLKGEKPNNNLCSKCKVQIEPLEGFYKRHPELKDN
ncbi:hypothetical protein SAMN05660337_0611 [Maridesulfovibrio ferrireducens]|uniref:Uncharacterized protein n=1 Tax=Maridesulfovibrio ferrireducens TaxID=246191 RepID=A0A1G9CAY1_9BACT|nr:hypothetical protein [Maridesulfovibrio ferrireducens]SDK48799.1 hypothetical protein SAMN05660337_0611 [Maridesulfovibrio ferrireducens]